MRYEELVEKVRNMTRNAKVSRGVGHVAFQFNVEGEAEGAFYVELADGKVYVEPYEYYDRDAIFTGTAELFTEIMTGKKDPVHEFLCFKLKVEGNLDKALKLNELIKRRNK